VALHRSSRRGNKKRERGGASCCGLVPEHASWCWLCRGSRGESQRLLLTCTGSPRQHKMAAMHGSNAGQQPAGMPAASAVPGLTHPPQMQQAARAATQQSLVGGSSVCLLRKLLQSREFFAVSTPELPTAAGFLADKLPAALPQPVCCCGTEEDTTPAALVRATRTRLLLFFLLLLPLFSAPPLLLFLVCSWGWTLLILPPMLTQLLQPHEKEVPMHQRRKECKEQQSDN